MSSTRAHFFPIVFVALLGHAVSAYAAPAGDAEKKSAALVSLREGNALLDEGDHAGALTKFRQAMALYPSPKLHYNIAQALLGLPGRSAETYTTFRRFLAEAKDASPATRGEAERKMIELESAIALLTVTVDAAGAQVLVDGTARGTTPLAGPLALDPGEHRVRIEQAGRETHESLVRLLARERAVHDVKLAVPQAATALPVFRPTRDLPPASKLAVDGTTTADQALLRTQADPDRSQDSEEPPLYARWWLWAGVGAVVAAGVVTALLLGGGGTTVLHDCSNTASPSTGTCDPLP